MAYQNQFVDAFVHALFRLRILLEQQLIIDNRLVFSPVSIISTHIFPVS